ncbi:IclR family transcriptional regulator C-terminal domain-containing protein [Streptomyces sp. NPDC006540]|uniref:IclR family transcriptional regulator domain-containing protein n=1 Tax=Streptomyces sp. NPDC006540 TaxID=3155353 RepID=UPI0033AF012C
MDAEDAWSDLNAVSFLMVCSPDATSRLSRLVDEGPVDWHGALVFACLLYLAGHHEGARFWWQFAAGADSEAAAYCLFLDHARQGEYHDAELWGLHLACRGFAAEATWGERASAPAAATLPSALLAHITDREHEVLGTIPTPRRHLLAVVRELARHAAAADKDMWMPELLELPDPPLEDRVCAPAQRGRPFAAPVRVEQAPPQSRWSELAFRHPSVTAAAQLAVTSRGDSNVLRQARLALDVVHVLEYHQLGASIAQITRESHLAPEQVGPILTMLCEEEFARPLADGVYAPGPAIDRLAAGPDAVGIQLQRTLALARDSIGAAVYISRYIDGEVHITQMADGPVTPAVNEWVDFRAAAHASAVGKCLLTQLDHDSRADHLARHKTARLTSRTITNSRTLFSTLDRLAANEPVFDLREYSPTVVCGAVPITTGTEAGSLALSLPTASVGRLENATEALSRKAVPVLLTLLLAGALPADGPDQDTSPLLNSSKGAMTTDTLNHLRRMFRTPLTTANAIQQAALSPVPGPHLVTDVGNPALYLFDADPAPTAAVEQPPLALPHTYAPSPPSTVSELRRTPEQLRTDQVPADGLLVFRT